VAGGRDDHVVAHRLENADRLAVDLGVRDDRREVLAGAGTTVLGEPLEVLEELEQVRHQLHVDSPTRRRRTVQRLERSEVERLVSTAYQDHSREGLLIKTLFLTGARVSEFVHIRVEDLFLDDDPPQIHITHAKGNADRYVPVSELDRHREAIRQSFEQQPVATIAEACQRIADLTGVQRGPTQVRKFLTRLGMEWRRVRAIPVPPKKVSRNIARLRPSFSIQN